MFENIVQLGSSHPSTTEFSGDSSQLMIGRTPICKQHKLKQVDFSREGVDCVVRKFTESQASQELLI